MSPRTVDDPSPDPLYRPFESIDAAELRRIGWLFRWGAWALGEKLWACEWTHNPLLTSLELRRHPRGPWLPVAGVLGGVELAKYASLFVNGHLGAAAGFEITVQCLWTLMGLVLPLVLVVWMVGHRVWQLRASTTMDDWRGTLLQPDHVVQAIALPPMALVWGGSWAITLLVIAWNVVALLVAGTDIPAVGILLGLNVILSLCYLVLLRGGVRLLGAFTLRAHLFAETPEQGAGNLITDLTGLVWGLAWRSVPLIGVAVAMGVVGCWPGTMVALVMGVVYPARYLVFTSTEALDMTVWEAAQWWGQPYRVGAAGLQVRPFAT